MAIATTEPGSAVAVGAARLLGLGDEPSTLAHGQVRGGLDRLPTTLAVLRTK